jgi:bifunctional non-homologous end joining protein LigD
VRREPIEARKATLASVLRSCRAGLQFNQHLEHPGHIVFRHACKMGLEGIVSKRPYPEDLIELRQGARIIEKSKP